MTLLLALLMLTSTAFAGVQNDSNTIKDVSLVDSNTTLTKDLSGSTIKAVDSTTSLTKEASLRDGSTSTLTKETSLGPVALEPTKTITEPIAYKETSLGPVALEPTKTITEPIAYKEPVLQEPTKTITKLVAIVCRNGATFSIDSDLGVSAFNLKCRGKGGLAAVTDSANAGAVAADFNSTNDADIFGLAYENSVSNYDSGSSSVGSLSDTTVSLNDSNTIKDVSLGDSNTTLTKDLSGSTIKTVDSTTSSTKEASLQDAIALEEQTLTKEASLRDGSTSNLTKEGSLDSVVYEEPVLADSK